MSYTITQESFDSLASCWSDASHGLKWSSVFVLPVWQKVWWQEFRPDGELYLGAVREDERIIGIAPLIVKDGTASIVGSTDVCDYLDFVIAPEKGKAFSNTLLDDLRQKGISQLDLHSLRPDSTVFSHLIDIAQNRRYGVNRQLEDVSVELELPTSWEEYLRILNAKQRHEVRRKLRRLMEAGRVEYHTVEDSEAVPEAMDTFLQMFTESRMDKADFLTDRRESFFRSLADAMAEAGLLRLGILELDSMPTAMILSFDYNGCIYLYNSGFDREYDSLSVGLLSKVLCIKESIEEGKTRFDFLKGDEIYKYRLGGKEIPLYSCQLDIN
ncbi:GNAT family N-acetyltransferase [Chloroflexota bacterium]